LRAGGAVNAGCRRRKRLKLWRRRQIHFRRGRIQNPRSPLALKLSQILHDVGLRSDGIGGDDGGIDIFDGQGDGAGAF
jgi:hypothetical protein